MITSELGLARTQEAMKYAREAYQDLLSKRQEYHPTNFKLIAAPLLEDIQRYEQEIADFELAVTSSHVKDQEGKIWPLHTPSNNSTIQSGAE
jgi:hypothetical protein